MTKTIRVTVSSPVFKAAVADIVREMMSGRSIQRELKSSARFKELPDGWIKDLQTGLEWGPSSDKKVTFKEAEKFCAENGGRLPDIKELLSLVDYDRREPAIDKEFFPDTKHDDYYWSGKKVAGYSDLAWCVLFRSGSVVDDYVGYSSYVRPCRASQ